MGLANTTDRSVHVAQPWRESEAVAYSRLLLPKKHGCPLWCPEPSSSLPKEYRDRGVTVGDLGVITADGAFSFLVNVCLPSEHPVNANGVPPDFEPFGLRPEDVTESPNLHAPGCVIASSSISWEGSLEPRGLWSSRTIEFTCSAWEGAFLVLPEGGSRFDLVRVDNLRNYAARNAQSWYSWASTGREVYNGALYLVTGADKAASWGVAYLPDSHERSGLTFSVAGGKDECAYVWESSGRGETRAGPKRSQGVSSSTGLENQCVFVRGFRLGLSDVKLRTAAFETPSALETTIMHAVPGKSDVATPEIVSAGGSTGALSEENTGVDGAGDMLRDTDGEPHPSSIVKKYLLDAHPEAEVVVIHDDDWMSAIREEDQHVPNEPELLNRVLAQRQPIKEGGSLHLVPTLDSNTRDMVLTTIASAATPHRRTSRPSTADRYMDSRADRYAYSSFVDASVSRNSDLRSRSGLTESTRLQGTSVSSGREPDGRLSAQESSTSPIDMETFNQIVELDDDDTYDFSWGMAWAYFDQAKKTFEDMKDALAKKDLKTLSSLGHFLKGSSAALGVARVQTSCEKIQHYGALRDEEVGIDLTPQEAIDKIRPLLVEAQADYKVAEQWLRDWFGSRRAEQG